MRVLVSGGRFWNNQMATFNFLSQFHQNHGIATLIHGAARGADTLCAMWAADNNIDILAFPITKSDWGRHGKAAGPIRNKQMLVEGRPNILIAFPGETGTRDMISQAKRMKLLTLLWTP